MMKGVITVPEQGYLQVHAYASSAQIPLKDVAITVTDQQNSPIAFRLTNRSGMLDSPLVISVPDISASQSPGSNIRPYGIINLYARKENYEQIGLGDEYSRCIEAFASMEVSGQAMSGGTSSPVPSLMDMLGSGTLGNYYGAGSSGSNGVSSSVSTEVVSQLLGTFLGGDVGSISGLNISNTNFLNNRVLSEEEMAQYYVEHSFDTSVLQWTDNSGNAVLEISEEQWENVQTLYANMFYDDGEGFLDLGLDNVYEFDEAGNLMAPTEATWLAINEQPVAYYHEATVDDGESYSMTGRVPVLYNGERAELVLEFTDENPYGSVVGVRRVYTEGETDTVAKTLDTVTDGDVIDFVCDYYSYDGEYLDSYMFGEQLVVDGELEISDVYIEEESANLTYLFTDIYQQEYWSQPVGF